MWTRKTRTKWASKSSPLTRPHTISFGRFRMLKFQKEISLY
jgi:hypothetical protein